MSDQPTIGRINLMRRIEALPDEAMQYLANDVEQLEKIFIHTPRQFRHFQLVEFEINGVIVDGRIADYEWLHDRWTYKVRVGRRTHLVNEAQLTAVAEIGSRLMDDLPEGNGAGNVSD